MKAQRIWVLGTPGEGSYVIVTDALSDGEVWVPDDGARSVEVEYRGRTLKRKEVPAVVVERKGKYDKVRFANGATAHIKRQEQLA